MMVHSFSNQLSQQVSARTRALPSIMQYVAALALGLIAAYSHVPWGWWGLYFLCVPVLLTLLYQAQSPMRGVGLSFCWAFGYFLPNVAWISRALTIDAEQFGWMVPVAIIVIPAYLALFYAVAARILMLYRGHVGTFAMAFAALWFLAELARGHWLFAFPWALSGYIWAETLPMLQLTSIVGIEGLSALTLFTSASLWLTVYKSGWQRTVAIIPLLCMVGGFFWGQQRLQNETMLTDVKVRLVQPNISQSLKWDADQTAHNYQILLELSATPTDTTPDLVIWPETASPYMLDTNLGQRLRAVAALAPHGHLMAGSNRATFDPITGELKELWNSLLTINQRGQIIDIYDKHHLVPFGEYAPLRAWLPVEKITQGSLDFSRGHGARTVTSLADIPPFSPLICYEAIFSSAVTARGQRPEWLLNITNDAWYGDSAGPYQHAAIARVRAIEEGLPMVRVANTGISFMADAYGRMRVQTSLNAAAVKDTLLPASLPPTLYSRSASLQRTVSAIILILCLFAAFFWWRFIE
jgi:apolipoprotein N-acyltransferase